MTKEISNIQEHNIDLEKQITHTVGVLDRRHTYLKAVEIVKGAAKEGGKIINLRSTKDTKERGLNNTRNQPLIIFGNNQWIGYPV